MSFRIENLMDNKNFIPVVADWIFSEFIQGKARGVHKSDIVQSLNSRNREKLPITYIGIYESECIATISIFTNDLKEREDLSPWLAALYVSEQYRKKGYAKGLIEYVVNKTYQLGYKKLYLRTETASEYYKKLGWSEIFDTIDENGLPTKVFEKSLV